MYQPRLRLEQDKVSDQPQSMINIWLPCHGFCPNFQYKGVRFGNDLPLLSPVHTASSDPGALSGGTWRKDEKRYRLEREAKGSPWKRSAPGIISRFSCAWFYFFVKLASSLDLSQRISIRSVYNRQYRMWKGSTFWLWDGTKMQEMICPGSRFSYEKGWKGVWKKRPSAAGAIRWP